MRQYRIYNAKGQLCTFISLLLQMALLSYARLPNCEIYTRILACQGRLPRVKEMTETVEEIIVVDIPECQWLSISEGESKDARVAHIELRKVCIDRIDPGYFTAISGPNMLRKLMMRKISGKAPFDTNAFQGLSNSLNQLTVIGDVFVDLTAIGQLHALTELELRHTNTSQMPEDFFKTLRDLRSLELTNVSVTHLPWNSIAEWLKEDQTRHFQLMDFLLRCDCKASKFRKLPVGSIFLTLDNIRCASPENMKGRILGEVPEEELCLLGRSADSLNQTSGTESGSGPVTPGETGSTSIRTEVIIAAAVVGVVVLCFVLFIIIYKVRMSSKNKRQRQLAESGSSRHQSTKYCAVIETPPATYSANLNGNKGDHSRHSGGQPV